MFKRGGGGWYVATLLALSHSKVLNPGWNNGDPTEIPPTDTYFAAITTVKLSANVNKPVCDLSLNTVDSWMDGLSHLMKTLSLGDEVRLSLHGGFFFFSSVKRPKSRSYWTEHFSKSSGIICILHTHLLKRTQGVGIKEAKTVNL